MEYLALKAGKEVLLEVGCTRRHFTLVESLVPSFPDEQKNPEVIQPMNFFLFI
jgi:hypothetical protein